jgi:hypothetical protein
MPTIILLYPPSPHSWNSFNRSHFFHLHTWVHNIFTTFILLHPFLIFSPIPLVTNLRQDLFYLPVLCFWKKNFCLFKIVVESVSLWHIHVYMYYNTSWFILSIFLLSTLVLFLWWFQQV